MVEERQSLKFEWGVWHLRDLVERHFFIIFDRRLGSKDTRIYLGWA